MRPPRTLVSTFSMMLSLWNPRIPGFYGHSLLQPRSLLSSVGNEAVQIFEFCLGLLKEALQPTGCFSFRLQCQLRYSLIPVAIRTPRSHLHILGPIYKHQTPRQKRGAGALLCPYSLCNPLEYTCMQLWGLEGLYCFNSNPVLFLL